MQVDSKQFQQCGHLAAVLSIALAAAAPLSPGGFTQSEKATCSTVPGWLCDADSAAASAAVPRRR